MTTKKEIPAPLKITHDSVVVTYKEHTYDDMGAGKQMWLDRSLIFKDEKAAFVWIASRSFRDEGYNKTKGYVLHNLAGGRKIKTEIVTKTVAL